MLPTQEVAKPLPQEQISPEKKAVEVPKYAWVILAVAFIASVAAPLNQFKVPPVMLVLMEGFQAQHEQRRLVDVGILHHRLHSCPTGRSHPAAAGIESDRSHRHGFLVVGLCWALCPQQPE